MGVGSLLHAPAALPLGKRSATHGAGDGVVHWNGLDECGKHRHHRDSICGQSSPQSRSTDYATATHEALYVGPKELCLFNGQWPTYTQQRCMQFVRKQN